MKVETDAVLVVFWRCENIQTWVQFNIPLDTV